MNTMMFLNLCGFFVLVFSTLQFADAAFFCHDCEGDGAHGTCTFDEAEGTRKDGEKRTWTFSCTDQKIAGGFREVLTDVRSQLFEEEKKCSKLENEVKHLNGKLTTCITEQVTLTKEHAETVEKHVREFNHTQSKLAKEQRLEEKKKFDTQRTNYNEEKRLIGEKHEVDVKLAVCDKQRDLLEKEKTECDSLRSSLDTAKEKIAWIQLITAIACVFVVPFAVIGCCCTGKLCLARTFQVDVHAIESELARNFNREKNAGIPALAQAQALVAPIETSDDHAQPSTVEEIPALGADRVQSSVRRRPDRVSESGSPVDQDADKEASVGLLSSGHFAS